LKLGDKVSVINESAKGLITKIEASTIWVEIDGLDFPYQNHELLVENHNEEDLQDTYKKYSPTNAPLKSTEKQAPKELSKKEIIEELGRVRGRRNSKGILEFDLHIHDLLAKTSHMTSGEMLNYQIDYAIHCMEAVIKKRESSFVFIHGIGKGVLRVEIHKIIRSYGFSFNDGFMKEYGLGATKVDLH